MARQSIRLRYTQLLSIPSERYAYSYILPTVESWTLPILLPINPPVPSILPILRISNFLRSSLVPFPLPPRPLSTGVFPISLCPPPWTAPLPPQSQKRACISWPKYERYLRLQIGRRSHCLRIRMGKGVFIVVIVSPSCAVHLFLDPSPSYVVSTLGSRISASYRSSLSCSILAS